MPNGLRMRTASEGIVSAERGVRDDPRIYPSDEVMGRLFVTTSKGQELVRALEPVFEHYFHGDWVTSG